ncbi:MULTISPECIES: gluconokinase [unclassified Agrobacterium]|uniref:gluconokinase n=1 Tax=unclassified Agrobacterium TaxID=2632611 RepID=UPI00244A9E63|nr:MULTISPECIES: gluconokinase [unclassified Agrobacterium]MDH0612782.1 gluconokinase [Agrobacterium sp. GD03872]MDH0694646.1 gluconokinase [Agrobacterium sp. GD03871]MDH1057956.1 gluconokinase [Agrobacterium sp. GD03992]MDH2209245.1 gluconokinase [Agrobacterium sp. GD03643]MDH2218736.1 gluconokinase [Agrobacterium sp. GD03638]
MGVSGSGKSTVAEELAAELSVAFIEGDRLHPKANVDKMSEGIPLTDEDRWPWLDLIGIELRKGSENNGIVVSCSALKKIYRDRLRAATGGPLAFVYLDGSLELLSRRMGERKGHFMPLSLLQTQLATLEVPTGEPGVVTVSIDATPEEITANALAGLKTVTF